MDDPTRAALSRERIDILADMVQNLRAELAASEARVSALRSALRDELAAARVYIEYTHDAYIADTEQDTLYAIYRAARALLEASE